ncbi:hypothetical protein M427DRAFT_421033 [Gonapodya prolifera JEL478]|uniref:Uncharacterized protein n=1 Tax=Gonapodya prolifera (strain JEL478) TaxID=1344416 RepID=A0A139A5L5_GONPJ|nr:hypothetical protein M427DRAFT_421033 [Gonapodya prolifera JEL478]|eukprot:KXS11693.1 hypothetical protein M427DRAFT_421033 [Gonapodya prolifera JEL478]
MTLLTAANTMPPTTRRSARSSTHHDPTATPPLRSLPFAIPIKCAPLPPIINAWQGRCRNLRGETLQCVSCGTDKSIKWRRSLCNNCYFKFRKGHLVCKDGAIVNTLQPTENLWLEFVVEYLRETGTRQRTKDLVAAYKTHPTRTPTLLHLIETYASSKCGPLSHLLMKRLASDTTFPVGCVKPVVGDKHSHEASVWYFYEKEWVPAHRLRGWSTKGFQAPAVEVEGPVVDGDGEGEEGGMDGDEEFVPRSIRKSDRTASSSVRRRIAEVEVEDGDGEDGLDGVDDEEFVPVGDDGDYEQETNDDEEFAPGNRNSKRSDRPVSSNARRRITARRRASLATRETMDTIGRRTRVDTSATSNVNDTHHNWETSGTPASAASSRPTAGGSARALRSVNLKGVPRARRPLGPPVGAFGIVPDGVVKVEVEVEAVREGRREPRVKKEVEVEVRIKQEVV